ncbi:MAG: ACT domain-containing protein [Gammaproteobacteria bacterium]
MTTDRDHWYMLTLVGEDRTGIVAHVTAALFDGGCHLGEASMMRLGGNFTVMLMVKFAGSKKALEDMLESVVDSFGLHMHMHIDHIEAHLHAHLQPDVRISVYGADRMGIVAKVTAALAETGLHILDLESDIAGDASRPIYIMHIEGYAAEGTAALQSALDLLIKEEGIEAHLTPVDTMLG